MQLCVLARGRRCIAPVAPPGRRRSEHHAAPGGLVHGARGLRSRTRRVRSGQQLAVGKGTPGPWSPADSSLRSARGSAARGLRPASPACPTHHLLLDMFREHSTRCGGRLDLPRGLHDPNVPHHASRAALVEARRARARRRPARAAGLLPARVPNRCALVWLSQPGNASRRVHARTRTDSAPRPPRPKQRDLTPGGPRRRGG